MAEFANTVITEIVRYLDRWTGAGPLGRHRVRSQKFATRFIMRTSVTGHDGDHGTNAATYREGAGDPHPAWRASLNQVIENCIGHLLVKVTFFAKGPQIELQRLHFKTARSRNVLDTHGGKVGLTGHRADAGEFGACKVDDVITLRFWIVESLQCPTRLGAH